MKSIKGNIIDVVGKQIYTGEIFYENGKLVRIEKKKVEEQIYILPGLIDAHIHIESSMLVPVQFARLAVRHGTTSVVADPHEIANVLGVFGVDYMIDNASKTPFKFNWGAPSCVPATGFETSGAELNPKHIAELLGRKEIVCLSEMMNFPAVIGQDKATVAMLNASKANSKPIDGHAPMLTGKTLQAYAEGGITTDHESSTIKEAEEKIALGIKLLIREGSAAKNFEQLYPLIDKYPTEVMLCSDDRHPDDLEEEHVSSFVKRALDKGCDFFNTLRAATYNPVKHYNLDAGLLQENDAADFIVVDNLKDFNVLKTVILGETVFDNDKVLLPNIESDIVNYFNRKEIKQEDIKLPAQSSKIRVIKAIDGDLLTTQFVADTKIIDGFAVSNTGTDVLKIVVINRYDATAKPVIGFINGFDLKKGAICGSIAHDSHNLIAVGVSDEDIVNAVNSVVKHKGGIAFVCGDTNSILPLPVAGLMSEEDGKIVSEKYSKINKIPGEYGCKLNSPFMTLSFMALLVIPELKIGDKGLFDGSKFSFTNLFV